MSRKQAIEQVTRHFESGLFQQILTERVAIRSQSQIVGNRKVLKDYLTQAMIPCLTEMGFSCDIFPNPVVEDPDAWPFLVAERIEDPNDVTLLTYGHGDVVSGDDQQWRQGLSPWQLVTEGDHWYGRGTADNKGQHSVNLAALQTVLQQRGKLGFNVKLLLEMGEEVGSPGLAEFCALHQQELQADLFLASDGPRVGSDLPTVFLGSRGAMNFDLKLHLREGNYHSGNWGGLLVNPATRLVHAWATLVDAHGKILVPGLLPGDLPESIRAAVKSIPVGQGENDPQIAPDWGEPDLSPAEQVFCWNTLEILAMDVGNPAAPLNAIPGQATLHAQIRFVVGSDSDHFLQIIRSHLDQHGFDDIEVESGQMHPMHATRLNPDDPWVHWILGSMTETTGKKTTLLPNLGGSIPNDCFANTLGLPTLWVPHSYPACLQHAPNEHALGTVLLESLQLMTGIFWDLGEAGNRIREQRVREQSNG
jgi:acetylornithine deacetylase/succinyl-diaminopimelate desuccinylase-like protein